MHLAFKTLIRSLLNMYVTLRCHNIYFYCICYRVCLKRSRINIYMLTEKFLNVTIKWLLTFLTSFFTFFFLCFEISMKWKKRIRWNLPIVSLLPWGTMTVPSRPNKISVSPFRMYVYQFSDRIFLFVFSCSYLFFRFSQYFLIIFL